jgi:hypothetical protein
MHALPWEHCALAEHGLHAPARHSRPDGHCAESVQGLQAPASQTFPAGHCDEEVQGAQAPARHTLPGSHCDSCAQGTHAPSMHTRAPHCDDAVQAVQAPAAQTLPPGHGRPSLQGRQAPSLQTRPAAHSSEVSQAAQRASRHTFSAGQAAVALHEIVPAGQAATSAQGPHTPLMQPWSGSHWSLRTQGPQAPPSPHTQPLGHWLRVRQAIFPPGQRAASSQGAQPPSTHPSPVSHSSLLAQGRQAPSAHTAPPAHSALRSQAGTHAPAAQAWPVAQATSGLQARQLPCRHTLPPEHGRAFEQATAATGVVSQAKKGSRMSSAPSRATVMSTPLSAGILCDRGLRSKVGWGLRTGWGCVV